jgi:nucleotide-binding universal stress UspA family protein
MNLAFKKIVMATDFSPPSELALQYARTLARRFGAELHLLHVVPEPFPRGAEAYMTDPANVRRRLVADAEQRLDKATANLRMPEITWHIRIGDPARLIAETAASHGADLIVIGTHGRRGIAHMMMGSVAERVVRHAACPVLTVHEASAAADAERLYAAATSRT